MAFFSNEVATTLQYYTFPLEVIGLTLAVIEVRFPGMARSIASTVEKAARPYKAAENERIVLWQAVSQC